MFFGEFTHQVDAKSRIRMPSAFKDDFAKKYAFRIQSEGVLSVYPAASLNEKFAFLSNASPFDVEAEKAISMFLRSFYVEEEDLQGRVMIPKSLRKAADLGKEIVIYAAGDHVNITSVKRHEEMFAVESTGDYMKKLDAMYKNHEF